MALAIKDYFFKCGYFPALTQPKQINSGGQSNVKV